MQANMVDQSDPEFEGGLDADLLAAQAPTFPSDVLSKFASLQKTFPEVPSLSAPPSPQLGPTADERFPPPRRPMPGGSAGGLF
jgi:hypothetical protein